MVERPPATSSACRSSRSVWSAARTTPAATTPRSARSVTSNERVTRTLYEISEAKGKEAGFPGGESSTRTATVRPIELRTPSTLFNRAFNEAATRSYLAAVRETTCVARWPRRRSSTPSTRTASRPGRRPMCRTAAADAPPPELRGTIEAMARDPGAAHRAPASPTRSSSSTVKTASASRVFWSRNLMGDLHHRIRHDPKRPRDPARSAPGSWPRPENMRRPTPDLMTPERLEAVRDGLVIVEQGASLEREAIAAFQRGGRRRRLLPDQQMGERPGQSDPRPRPAQTRPLPACLPRSAGSKRRANASGSGNRRLTPGEMYRSDPGGDPRSSSRSRPTRRRSWTGAAIGTVAPGPDQTRDFRRRPVNRVAGQLAGGVGRPDGPRSKRSIGASSAAASRRPRALPRAAMTPTRRTDRHIQINGGSVNVLTERGPLSNVDPWDLTDPAAVSYQIGRAKRDRLCAQPPDRSCQYPAPAATRRPSRAPSTLIRALDDGDHYALWNDLWSEMDPVARAYWEEAPTLPGPGAAAVRPPGDPDPGAERGRQRPAQRQRSGSTATR